MQRTLLVIVGATATGKTECAIQLAKHFNTEVVSADSRQFYREMNIGVARPNEVQLKGVKHHFIACRSVKEEYNAGEYEKDALACLEDIFRKKDNAVLVGGSGLYIRAVCEGFDALPPADEDIRRQLDNELHESGLGHLQQELKKVDPEYYKTADIQNPRRVMRALEVYRVTGKPFSSFHKIVSKKREFRVIKIGLDADRKTLYERINNRVDEMMRKGLLEEAKSLLPLRKYKALHTVGYEELFDHFDGKTDLETAVNLIKQHSRNFAKRQLTWFRKDKDIKWFGVGGEREIVQYVAMQLE